MKLKNILSVLLLTATVTAMAQSTVITHDMIIMMDKITVVIPKTCERRPQITTGTHIEKLFNLKPLNVGDSWYHDGCNFQKTVKRCQYKKDSEIGISFNTLKPSSLSHHYTYDVDSDGRVIMNCSLHNNYKYGESSKQYGDMQVFYVHDDYLEGWAFSDWGGSPDENWWIRTNRVIEKKKFSVTW